MKKLTLGLLLICSINILLASSHTSSKITSSRIAIGFNPADFTPIPNHRNVSPGALISTIEEELTNSNCSSDSGRSYILVDTEDPKAMKKYREVIEEENNNENNDPDTRLTPHFIAATHLVKGNAAFDHGCAMVYLSIEDRKGSIVAQKKIFSSNIRKPEEIFKLIKEATSSLRYQICNLKSSKVKLIKKKVNFRCRPYYFTIRTSIEYKKNTSKMLADKSLLSQYNLSSFSKQIMHIDPKKGIIEIVGIKSDAKNRYEGQGDKFDRKSCSVVHKRDKTIIDENVNDSLANIEAYNIFNSNDKDAFIKISVANEQFTKKFKVPWSVLKDSGTWSGSDSKNKSKFDSDEFSAIGKEESAKIMANTKIYKQLKELMKLERSTLPKMRADGRKNADLLGLTGEDRCKIIYFGDIFFGYTNIHITYNAKFKVNISPASKFDIDIFKLHKEDGKTSRVFARKIVPSKFEKEPTAILDVLQNSIYEKISDRDKKAWDKADKEHEDAIKNKKDVEEFDNLSIDDLEMFTK